MERKKAPTPTYAIFIQRQVMVWSIVLTLITMSGKVRNINHRAIKKDLRISLKALPGMALNLL